MLRKILTLEGQSRIQRKIEKKRKKDDNTEETNPFEASVNFESEKDRIQKKINVRQPKSWKKLKDMDVSEELQKRRSV
jgi:hypothetical protein